MDADDADSVRAVRAALVLVSRDPPLRDRVGQELEKRYGADYAVAVCASEEDLPAEVARLAGQGVPIAAFLAGLGPEDPDGLGVLARAGGLQAGAVRACIVRWGDLETAAPVFEAITLGRLDGWLYRPERAGDAEFHLAVSELLAEWDSRQGAGYEAVQVIGERWSPRSQELRDMFDRNRVPTGFYEASSPAGQELLAGLGMDGPELPVVVLRFRPDSPVLTAPSAMDIAAAFGLLEPVDGDTLLDVVVVGAGPAGLSAAVYAASEGLRTAVIEPLRDGRAGGHQLAHPQLPGLPARRQREPAGGQRVPAGVVVRGHLHLVPQHDRADQRRRRAHRAPVRRRRAARPHGGGGDRGRVAAHGGARAGGVPGTRLLLRRRRQRGTGHGRPDGARGRRGQLRRAGRRATWRGTPSR